MNNPIFKELAEKAKNSVPSGLDPVEWINQYNQIYADLIIDLIESYIEEAEDLQYLELMILLRLRGEWIDD